MERKNRIMVVDDNLIDQMITVRVLKTSYAEEEIILMESAAQALAYLNENINKPELLPNLILLDLDMPIMNGIGFLNKFNQFADGLKDACRIVVLTASDVLSDIEQMRSHPNVLTLIPKPLNKYSLNPVI
ncbi:response regulator [Pedobacter sp. UC225_65]|uniref:response regulator n=1 Tax=Pedobacter sp. UC225_65 TaxID=3350173 RepID=UPI00366E4524